MVNQDQLKQMGTAKGFIAALDQSGGSTPRALRNYGIPEDPSRSEAEMFDMVHALRTRIATAPAFNGDNVIGAILFEMTMEREINGKPSAQYMWEDRRVVPFLKVDKGLEAEVDGVQLMKAMPDLDATLTHAKTKGIFGTKMRSVVNAASPSGIKAIVEQQFEVAAQINSHGIMPIIEPEITISIDDKTEAEEIMLDEIGMQLDALPSDQQVMIKLTLPNVDNHYKSLVDHPRSLRIVALSGGYYRDEANLMLAKNTGMIASYSRGLSEGLTIQQNDNAFNASIAMSIKTIVEASST